MILTIEEAISYQNGTLDKKLFEKLKEVIGFENYLFHYCKISNDYRNGNIREVTFKPIFGYTITVFMNLGKVEKLNYQK